jgi:hypothetical protein
LELSVTLYSRFQLRTIIPFLESTYTIVVATLAIGGAPQQRAKRAEEQGI